MASLSSQTKTLLAVAAIIVLIYLFYRGSQSVVHNDGSVELEAHMESHGEEDNNIIPENIEEHTHAESESNNSESANLRPTNQNWKYKNIPVPKEDMVRYFPQRDYAAPESDWLRSKFNSRNKSQNGFKRSSYSGALRGNLGPSDWDDYFDHNNNVIGNSQTGDNDKFLPLDESNGGFAVFKSKGRATCGSNQNCEPEDLFDVDKYLPQEVNDDWFEVQPEPISVKNRHLINITKPIGINTIGTSLKNASHDLRGNPACPKTVVSPWLQSSIEPDTNLKPLY
ncbi:MAG: hypothetical protein Homavirus5_9 [Homavirus sp.]|uniref:Minor capsid protein P11 C-terminal conserved region domain-containing protein n=1 Tax=Homavirus sp. TaxID=2487769 RepID=A0A3G5A4C8_9VIRU|nr:MAG: hypothetical protein Homavirus5_9 [Homavirus sp.]